MSWRRVAMAAQVTGPKRAIVTSSATWPNAEETETTSKSFQAPGLRPMKLRPSTNSAELRAPKRAKGNAHRFCQRSIELMDVLPRLKQRQGLR